MNKILPLISLIIAGVIQTNAKTTSWNGGAADWHVSTFWSNGLPGSSDSAIISGTGSDVTIPTGLIISVLYVEVDGGAHLLIESGALLAVSNTMGRCIHVYNGSTLTNRGLLSIPKSGNSGIHARSNSSIINEGNMTIDSTDNGISINVNSSLSNTGKVFISNSDYGIFTVSESTIENDGLIDISKCAYSIDMRHVCYFENRDSVCIRNGLIMGLKSYGEVVNNGNLSIINMEDPGDYAILNDSFSCCDTFYIGTFTNNGMIQISNSEGDGLVCLPSTTFFNFGEMHISNCAQRGIMLEPLAQLRVENGGIITVSSTGEPLEVGVESNFVVRSGGNFDASILDSSN